MDSANKTTAICIGPFLFDILKQTLHECGEQSRIDDVIMTMIRDAEELSLPVTRKGLRVSLAIAILTADVPLQKFTEIFPPDMEVLSPAAVLHALKKVAETNPSPDRRLEDLMDALYRFRVALGSLTNDEQDPEILVSDYLVNAIKLVRASSPNQQRIMSTDVRAYMARVAALRAVHRATYVS
ncbi:hypothetical protein KBC59_03735 [Patescibacteria group bacterium]|nr:hypothetical protein [Patescibacteria group bacterium]